MNLFKVSFSELYERHLCRHSQYGINVVHLAAVFGIYLASVGILSWIIGSEWLLLCLIVPHLILVAFNVPFRVFVGSVLFMSAFFALFAFAPKPPVWVDVLAIPFLYKIQAWSHKVYNVACDMTEYNKKYRKGFVLFVLLSLYELPLLLNYLAFDRNNWPAWFRRSIVDSPAAPETPSANPNAESTILSSQR